MASGLVLACVLYTAHYLVYCLPQPFFIEDAGISFAYARNLVNGDGLATYAGGPRVEGYSNPTWTFLIAILYAVGLPMFTTAKVLGWLFGVMTLPFVWGLTRRALPDRGDAPFHRDNLALIAPFALAINVQFVVWNSSGLENSLFCFLLATALYRCVIELEDQRKPLSAALFFLLCISRPEGIMYTMVALGLRAWHALFSEEAKGRTLWERVGVVGPWLCVLLVPLVAYHAWRYWYFAWEFPNTYYAKMGTGRSFKPFSWTRKGWKYINAWMLPHGGYLFAPVLLIGLIGFGRRLRWLALILVALLAVLVFWDGKEGLDVAPSWWEGVASLWVKLRVWAIAALVPILWFAALRSRAWRSRGLLWLCASAGLFFALYVGGDWMKAHRWFNLFSVALIAIVTVGIAEIAWLIAGPTPVNWGAHGWVHHLKHRHGWALIFLGLCVSSWTVNESRLIMGFVGSPETSVRDIHRRVMYMRDVQKTLDIDHVTLLDVDMGAHMFYTDWAIVDIAGLVDVSMARHSDFNKKFLREYLFKERRPDFAHVHGGWARASRIPKLDEWKDTYIEIPGYPIGTRRLHIGNHINKNIFVTTKDERVPKVSFESDVHLVDVNIPSPLVQPGAQIFVYTAWRAALRKAGFRVLIALTATDGTRTVGSFAPGYGWYPAEEWKRSETVETKFRVPVPKDFPRGPVTVSMALLDQKSGRVLAVKSTAESEETEHPWMGGAYDLTGTVLIGDGSAVADAAEADRIEAIAFAESGDCESVWPAWKNAIRHGPFRKNWIQRYDASLRQILARCYAQRASETPDVWAKADTLLLGMKWSHKEPELVAQTRPLAKDLEARGDALWEGKKLERAYRAFSTSIELDPSRSWARRKAEDVRDLRLKITRPGRKKDRKKRLKARSKG